MIVILNLSFLTDPPAGGVDQESHWNTGDSCFRRNDIHKRIYHSETKLSGYIKLPFTK